jgi:lysozyme family protein
MIATFADVFALVVGTESTAVSSDPQDPGNWSSGVVGQGQFVGSKFGISAAAFPGVDIISLTYGQAQALAKQRYWDPYQLDQLNPVTAYPIFDAAYNGFEHLTTTIQGIAGVTQDGVIGAQTLAALRQLAPARFALAFMADRYDYWTGLDLWPNEGRGWARRGATIMSNIFQNT